MYSGCSCRYSEMHLPAIMNGMLSPRRESGRRTSPQLGALAGAPARPFSGGDAAGLPACLPACLSACLLTQPAAKVNTPLSYSGALYLKYVLVRGRSARWRGAPVAGG